MFTTLRPARLSFVAAALLVLAAPHLASAARPPQDVVDSASPAVVESPALAVVGASVSAGFRLAEYEGLFSNLRVDAERLLGRDLSDEEYARRTDSVRPGDVLAAVYGFEVATFGNKMLFSDPLKRGREVLEAGLATGAETVVGVDLMFWFGYGRTDEGGAESTTDQRLSLQVAGFGLLEELFADHPETTLVLGDYPDMTGAWPAMITPDMIPSAEERAELNRRLAAWAETLPNVVVFPLSASLQRLRDGESSFRVDGELHSVSIDAAFQLALVHPTRLGTAVLVRDLVEFLASHVDEKFRPHREDDEQFLDAAGA